MEQIDAYETELLTNGTSGGAGTSGIRMESSIILWKEKENGIAEFFGYAIIFWGKYLSGICL